jgi:Xaa-Pro aminopeptidase
MFQQRREEFLRRMGEGVAIIATSPVRRRNGDVDYKFRPESHLYYLTGFAEPEAVLLMCPSRAEERIALFVPPRDREREIWTGRRSGTLGALTTFGADAAYPMSELDERLPKWLENQATVHFAFGHDADLDRRVLAALNRVRGRTREGIHAPSTFVDPAVLLDEMRLQKDPVEVDILRRAAAITEIAHRHAMAVAEPGKTEFEIEALVDYMFRKNGAIGPGYPTIVAGGSNATVLHYTRNDSVLRDGDLLLIDAGAEYEMYTADVTRTFPVSKRFSDPQREVYELVLRAQLAAIAAVEPGTTLEEVHRSALRVLVNGLLGLGFLAGSIEDILKHRSYRRFYMHRTSHWLGMDVHDVGAYTVGKEPRKLAPGMVLTVEPGLYIEHGAPGVDPRYHGIGVRIEDDVLVTPAGREVLTEGIPKAIPEIEAACRGEPVTPLSQFQRAR